ncbi:hypothetical protein K439DRAFT_1659511 [Ramaria rubella]|nr:hypothetical protein K439DRAFT_1659511 [Ramaria rubella]
MTLQNLLLIIYPFSLSSKIHILLSTILIMTSLKYSAVLLAGLGATAAVSIRGLSLSPLGGTSLSRYNKRHRMGMGLKYFIYSTCQSTLLGVAGNQEASSCLNVPGLAAILTLQPNSSAIPSLNTWLQGLCAANPCSNDTINAISTNITNGCQADISGTGVNQVVLQSILQDVPRFYPTVRSIACLKSSSNDTLCATSTLLDVQQFGGQPLTANSAMNAISEIVSQGGKGSLPTNLTCTGCTQAAFDTFQADQALLAANPSVQSAISSQCGANFLSTPQPTDVIEGTGSAAPTGSVGSNLSANGAVSMTLQNGAFWGFAASSLLSVVAASTARYTFMDSSSPSASRRRTFDLPKSSPDAGLAEWTSKIKAIQQEVDRDEETESRRLQEEIAQSRLDRAKRRNTGTGSIDWTQRGVSPVSALLDETKAAVDKQQHQSDTLKKLSGTESPNSSSSPSAAASVSRSPLRQEGISLAAFMGGRATGPRLNKATPQQDSSDATLFDQTRREGPHPIFGRSRDAVTPDADVATKPRIVQIDEQGLSRNGSGSKLNVPVAMHGSASPVERDVSEVIKTTPECPKKPELLRMPSNKAAIVSEIPQVKQPGTPPDIPPKPKFSRSLSQESSISEKSLPSSSASTTSPKPTSLAELIGGRGSGPRLNKPATESPETSPSLSLNSYIQGHALPGMSDSKRLSSPPAFISSSPGPISSRTPPPQNNIHNAPSPKPHSSQTRSFSGSMITTPSLARPVQPQAVAQPSPIAAASTIPSPAFLRVTPSTQDLHPSLSRLQGRGFVEQRVKATTRLYGESSPQPRDRSTSSGSSAKRPTVLDRWQPIPASPSPPPTKPSEHPAVTQAISVQHVIKPHTTSPGLVKRIVNDEKQEAAAPIRLPGMAAPTSSPPKQWSPPATVSPTSPTSAPSEFSEANPKHQGKLGSAAPLSHPTRDRARKPRKRPNSSNAISQTKPSGGRTSVQDFLTGTPCISIQTTDNFPRAGEVTEPQQDEHKSPRVAKPQISSSTADTIQRLKDTLIYQPPPEVRVSTPPQTSEAGLTNHVNSSSPVGRHPLPGTVNVAPSPLIAPRPTIPASPTSEDTSPTPSRHSRIPSTGQRATVMDVAQALQQHEQHIRETSWTPEPESEERQNTHTETLEEDVEDTPRTDVKAVIAGWGRSFGPVNQSPERRRSSYDRFSVATLPPLVEEKTPVATPEASLSRGFTQTGSPPPQVQAIHERLKEWSSSEMSEPNAVISHSTSEGELENKSILNTEESLVQIEHQDRPPPAFNLQSILKEVVFLPDMNCQTISVDILSITGHTATAITREPNVFYDTEIIAVIHRVKGMVTQLVSNKVWIWRGRNAELGEKEGRKAHELTERFGTTATYCSQGSEPPEFIHILGGVLAIRQGTRAHWSGENTAMHRVHSSGDSIFVDELDLNISNLCSAFSFCLSVLDTLYVWHGRGATEDERRVASAYGESLTTSKDIMEFEEGAEDEMFWMVLGNNSFANADHWKFRPQLNKPGTRLYAIDSSRTKTPVQLIPSIIAHEIPDDGVFVVDCRLEIYVVVAPRARGKRTDIQLGLFLAENISVAAAAQRPFDPPIHIVILPSKLPLELRASIRFCDEERLNGGPVPNHMNLVPLVEAMDHMQRRSWPKSLLSDPTFLPLGIDPTMF